MTYQDVANIVRYDYDSCLVNITLAYSVTVDKEVLPACKASESLRVGETKGLAISDVTYEHSGSTTDSGMPRMDNLLNLLFAPSRGDQSLSYGH